MRNKIDIAKIKKEVLELCLRIPTFDDNGQNLRWAFIINEFPLDEGKKKLLKTASHGIAIGITTDHLLSVAAMLEIPSVYLKEINEYRRYVKTTTTEDIKKKWRVRLINATNNLLLAVEEAIVKLKME